MRIVGFAELMEKMETQMKTFDGVSIEDIYNHIVTNYGDKKTVSYEGDGLFIFDRKQEKI